MHPRDYIRAARVPETLQPQEFGLWQIARVKAQSTLHAHLIGFDSYTLLSNWNIGSLHLPYGEIVMEDSRKELSRHLPIWLQAKGRVLITGLGLGCVVRGLLASPFVTHVDVIEINEDILRIVGAEFVGNERVTLHHGDAREFEFPEGTEWDFAWHDIWTEGNEGLHLEHMKLIKRFIAHVDDQGAWQLPRELKQLCRRNNKRLLGA